jgi:quercetin dioxygenase-like cupin family protein
MATRLSPQATEACIYVTQGQLEIKLGEKIYRLGRGDSIYFEGVFLRRLLAQGDEPVHFIMALTPSVF